MFFCNIHLWLNTAKLITLKNVTKMLQKCYKNVTKMLQKCYKNVTKIV